MDKQIYSGSFAQPVIYYTPVNSKPGKILYRLFIAVTAISIITLFTTAFAGNLKIDLTREVGINSLLDSLNNSGSIYFDYGKAELKQDNYPTLNELGEILKNDNNLKLLLSGYTDNTGSDGFNFNLSLNRAIAVKIYLVSLGVNELQIQTEGKGEIEPVNDNSDENLRKLNRRVVFTLTNKNIYSLSNTEKTAATDYYEQKYAQQDVNTVLITSGREEISAEITVRDSTGTPYENLKESDITANLKWDVNGRSDSTEGMPRLIPINDKKKLAITLTMDYSGSMYGTDKYDLSIPKSNNILQMEKSVEQFIKQMNNKMYGKIIKFGSTVNVTSRFSASKEVLQKSLEGNTFPMGGTALYRSIYTALMDTTYQSNPTIMKTIIAFTDGMENASGRLTLDSIFNKAEQTNTKIFTVGLFEQQGNFVASEQEKSRGKSDLLSIAQRTGGFFYNAVNANLLSAIYDNIFKQVLNSYNVSIVWNSSKLPPKGTLVKAEVKINVMGKVRTFYKNYIIE